jgi:hypothetical protein
MKEKPIPEEVRREILKAQKMKLQNTISMENLHNPFRRKKKQRGSKKNFC